MSRSKPLADLRRLAALPPDERALLGRALVAATVVEIGVRCLPLAALANTLGIALDSASADDERAGTTATGTPTLARAAVAVDRVYRRWPFKATCLRRALTLGALLRREQPLLRLGVRRNASAIEAHAWLVVAGREVGAAPQNDGYRRLRVAAG